MTRDRTITLRYGRSQLPFSITDHADLLDINEPPHTVSKESFLLGLNRLLPPVLPNGTIAIVVADKTRLCGYPRVLPWLTAALHSRGASRDQLIFYIAYGTHAHQSDAESQAAYGWTYDEYTFVHHTAIAPTPFTELGRTHRGTPIRVRSDLLAASLIITVGALSHHYFAGFGGGRKLLFPGLGEQEAIYTNHRLFLDTAQRTLAPGCRPGQLTGNPLAEDLAEIEGMLPPYLAIHGLLDSHGEVAAYRFGDSVQDFLAACHEHDACFRADIDRQYDLVLASAGGYPKDINFIQSHKALDNAAAFVRNNGTLIMLAECADGIGSSTFLPYFKMGGQKVAFDHLINAYSGNGGTALAMMAKTDRIRIAMVTTLAPQLCQQIGVSNISAAEVARTVRTSPEMAVIANASMLVRDTHSNQNATL